MRSATDIASASDTSSAPTNSTTAATSSSPDPTSREATDSEAASSVVVDSRYGSAESRVSRRVSTAATPTAGSTRTSTRSAVPAESANRDLADVSVTYARRPPSASAGPDAARTPRTVSVRSPPPPMTEIRDPTPSPCAGAQGCASTAPASSVADSGAPLASVSSWKARSEAGSTPTTVSAPSERVATEPPGATAQANVDRLTCGEVARTPAVPEIVDSDCGERVPSPKARTTRSDRPSSCAAYPCAPDCAAASTDSAAKTSATPIAIPAIVSAVRSGLRRRIRSPSRAGARTAGPYWPSSASRSISGRAGCSARRPIAISSRTRPSRRNSTRSANAPACASCVTSTIVCPRSVQDR